MAKTDDVITATSKLRVTHGEGGAEFALVQPDANKAFLNGNTGIRVLNPLNTLDVNGAVAIGSRFAGVAVAPENGLIVERNVGIGTTSPEAKLHVEGNILTKKPTDDGHAATKKYVDDQTKAAVDTHANAPNPHSGHLAKTGGEMTGFLTLSAAPTAERHAATKKYVDDHINAGNPHSGSLAKAGDTMTGLLTLSAAPTQSMHAATKQYVDDHKNAANPHSGSLAKSGDTMTGDLRITNGNLIVNGLVSGGNLEGTLTTLDVRDNFDATVRARDLWFGHSSRRGSPGRALVDWGDTLQINYEGAWRNGCRYYVSMDRVCARKYKDDIVELSGDAARRILDQLNPVSFRLKSYGEPRSYLGFIAEDVPAEVGAPDGEAVNTDHIVAVLTRIVKDQQQEISRLREMLMNLTGEPRSK